jgi:hypothetical protein
LNETKYQFRESNTTLADLMAEGHGIRRNYAFVTISIFPKA